MSEILLDELFEKRDFYLYSLKHLEFKNLDDSDPKETQKLLDITLNELHKVEKEISNLLNSSHKN